MGSYMGHEYADAPAPAEQVQGRYRVGDRVNVVPRDYETDWSGHDAKVGETFTISNQIDDDEMYRAENDSDFWFFYPHELAPALRPGDRVKLNKHHGSRGCGERGTVTAVLGDAATVRMDELSYWGGRVAVFPDSVLDWERDEERAADCAGRKEQQAKPKFKAGDVVRVVKKVLHFLNLIGTVRTSDSDMTCVEFADGDRRYFYLDEIELDAAAPCPQDNEQQSYEAPPFRWGVQDTAIVALVKHGQPRPSTYPHVHASVAAATTEAERLARINPGQEFAVYQRVTARVAEVQMKEVA